MDGVDIVCDVRSLPIKSFSVDCISASDVLEHVYRLECSKTLSEWNRTLKKWGEIRLKVPDLRMIAYLLVNKKIDGYEAARLIYGQQDYPENLHRNGFTKESLRGELIRSGFSRIQISQGSGHDANNIIATAAKRR